MRKAGLAVFSLLMLLAVPCFAQNTNSGDIRGTVTDASGAVVPGVSVTVLDVDKGISKTINTNDAGFFDTGSIVPDHYTLTFTKTGYSTYVRGPIVLAIGITDIDAQLTVGSTTQTVHVTTAVPLLETETAAVSTSLDQDVMVNLPQTGGTNWTSFMILNPGTSAKNSAQSSPGEDSAAVNGNLPFNTVLSNGAVVTLPASQNADYAIFETVSEVKVDSNAFTAEYGLGGVVYNQITKGGTDKYHAAAYDYLQNNDMNAAPYEFGARHPVPVQRYNQYGFTFNGPVPKVGPVKNMFFYFLYERTQSIGGASSTTLTVPTTGTGTYGGSYDMLTGDFTGQPTIYDPRYAGAGTGTAIDPQTVVGSTVTRTSFASEYGSGNKLPSTALDSVSKAEQAYYPAPDTAGTLSGSGVTTNNWYFSVATPSHTNKYYGRMDWDITPNNRLTLLEDEQDSPNVGLGVGEVCPVGCSHGDGENNQAQISDVQSFSAQTINEVRLGFNFEFDFVIPSTYGIGMPAALGWQFAKADNFPSLNIGPWGSTGNDGGMMTTTTNAVYKEMVFDPSDVITLIRGKQVFRFGGEFLMNRLDSTIWGNTNSGTFNFTGNYTSSTGSDTSTYGSPYADFLLGFSNGWNASFTPEYGARLKNPQLFVQDDIKLRRNLTVNLGVRWQGITGWKDVHGDADSFDPNVINPADSTLGAMWYEGTAANGRTSLQAPIWDTFLPRIGFSYQVLNNTVVHGGFGVYGTTFSNDMYGSGQGEQEGGTGSAIDSSNGIYPQVINASTGSVNYQAPVGGKAVNTAYVAATTDPAAFNGTGISIAQGSCCGEYFYSPYHTPVAQNMQWNIGVQRQLGANFVADVMYVGNHGWNLPYISDINSVPDADLAAVAAGTMTVTQARPYPLFGDISGFLYTNHSNYNALEGILQKRMSNGLTFNVNFTWEHMLDDQDAGGHSNAGGNPYVQDVYNASANYGNSDVNTPRMFKGYAIYQIPVGVGRKYMNNNYIADALVGGWQVSGTLVADSGEPFDLVMATDTSDSQDGWTYPNAIASPYGTAGHTVANWYNVAGYLAAAPAPGVFGNNGRDNIFGPDMMTVNLSAGKTFTIPTKGEHTTFEIRADATNAFNHPAFANPDATISTTNSGSLNGVTIGGRNLQIYGRIAF